MPTNIHSLATSLIPAPFQCTKGKLEELKENMSIPIVSFGAAYSQFSFDVSLDKRNYPNGLFPFFNKISEAHKVCDYTLIVTKASKVFILLVELKKGEGEANSQLNAGECLAKYVLDTINRINGTHFKAEFRKITVRELNLARKGTVKVQKAKVINGFATFHGKEFYVDSFIE